MFYFFLDIRSDGRTVLIYRIPCSPLLIPVAFLFYEYKATNQTRKEIIRAIAEGARGSWPPHDLKLKLYIYTCIHTPRVSAALRTSYMLAPLLGCLPHTNGPLRDPIG